MTTSHLLRANFKVLAYSLVLVVAFLVSILFRMEVAQAAVDPVTGYAWSVNIGWICFDCGTAGVYIDSGTGNFAGYAWSDNIGWIDFAPTIGYPEAPFNSAQLQSGGTVTGWARALSYGGGWDGWIKMSGTWGGVTHDGSKFDGFAWGGDVVGWIDFSPTTGPGVSYATPPPPATAPANLSDNGMPPVCDSGTITLTWRSVMGADRYELLRDGLLIYNGPSTSYIDTGLTAGVNYTYTVRATNSGGNSPYSAPFNISAPPACVASAPSIDSPTATDITDTTATLGASITSDGGSAITSRGTCWGLSPNPVTNCSSEGGTAISIFSHGRTGLPANTFIYYRGYAENAIDIDYSPDGTFTTNSSVPNPNLVSNSLSFSAGPYTVGSPISLDAVVENIGLVSTGDTFEDNFTYQWNGIGGVWLSFAGNVITHAVLGSLGTSPDSASFTPGQTGTLYIQHCVDSAGGIDEGPNEAPNCTVSSGITVTSGSVNLETSGGLSAIAPTPDGDNYDNVVMNILIKNVGLGTLPSGENIKYKATIDLDPVGGGPDMDSGIEILSSGLAPGGEFTDTFIFNDVPFGTHSICFRVNFDPPNEYPENPPASILTGNQYCKEFTLLVPRPDTLIISVGKEFVRSRESIEVAWDVYAPYELSCTVQGPGGANESFNVPPDTLVSDKVNPDPLLKNTGEFKLTCTAITGESFEEIAKVEVIPNYEEQ